jgi:hypothetical protein
MPKNLLKPVSLNKTPIRTPVIAEITSDLSDIQGSLLGGIKEGGERS